MCNISTIMYHVIHDDHLEIKLIVLYCIVLYSSFAASQEDSRFEAGM